MNNKAVLTSENNGKTVRVLYAWDGLSVVWADSNPASPAGRLEISIDGDDLGGNNTIDLGAGERAIDVSKRRAFADICPSGIPSGCEVHVYFT